MRIALIGYGRMGQMVGECIGEAQDLEIAGLVDIGYLASLADVQQPDVAIDFSHPSGLADLLAVATRQGVPLVIGCTGMEEEHEAMIRHASGEIPIVCAGNYSVGIAVLQRVVREMTVALGEGFDVEIVEAHHRKKLDAPSGTAHMLVEAVDPTGTRPVRYGREGRTDLRGQEIGVHAIRGGTVCGEHTVRFLGDMEELAFTHRAESRRIFALGALRAARFVAQKSAGLYTMEQVLFG